MLVIISDLHLSDGTLVPGYPAAAIGELRQKIQQSAIAASHRVLDEYHPIDRVDLLLLGDTIDFLRSAHWTQTQARLWNAPHSAPVAVALTQILLGVLSANAEAISELRELARLGIEIPACSPSLSNQVDYRAPQTQVPVYLHYMVGNADWPLRLPGKWLDQLREVAKLHFGLANRSDFPFPHDQAESPLIGELLRRHRLQARHGDIYDALNFVGDRNTSTLGDAIVIELINNFTLEVEQEFGPRLPADLLAHLKSIHYVRPVLRASRWLEALLEDACDSTELRAGIERTWSRLVDRLLELPAVRSNNGWNSVDLIDGLRQALKINGRHPLGQRYLAGISLVDCAQAEQESRRHEIDYVVYGHGHSTDRVPLKNCRTNDGELSHAYFNLGQPSLARETFFQFESNHATNALAFFQNDECQGRRYAALPNKASPNLDLSLFDQSKWRRSA